MSNLLVVAGNVSLATGLVLDNTVLEGQCQSTSKLAARKITLAGGGDIDSLDVESSTP